LLIAFLFHSLLVAHRSLLLFFTHCSLLIARCFSFSLITHHSLLIAHRSSLIAFFFSPIAHHSLLIASLFTNCFYIDDPSISDYYGYYLSGLVSKKLPQLLISKRRDIMIESAAYGIIKEEGLKQGRKEGLQEGILENLEIRFNVVPESIAASIRSIENLDILRILRRNSLKVSSLEEMKILLRQVKE
jgi:hypothetical protein